jgi:cytidine deaminase
LDSLPSGVDPGDQALYEVAREAAASAHAPYSRFRVGAAVRTLAGGVFQGCNVENASYGLSVCAERSAVFAAVATEGPGMRLDAVAVFADARTVPPCGACRQVIAEFGPDARVIFRSEGRPVATSASALLPHRFELDP